MKLKRVLSMALCVLMLASLLPVSALAEDIVNYELWVNGVGVSDANAADVLGNGKVSFDAGSRTLSLNGATINETKPNVGDSSHLCGILYLGNEPLTIAVNGYTTISTLSQGAGDPSGAGGSCGIYSKGALTLTGSGYLSVSAGTAVYAVGGLTIDSGLHAALYSVTSQPVIGAVSFPYTEDDGEEDYNDWRTSKDSLNFEDKEPSFANINTSPSYFEVLGAGHSKSYADNGNGTHRISCSSCGAGIVDQTPHTSYSTTCSCGIQLAQVGENVNYANTVGYWQLHEALAEAANQTSSTRVELLYSDNATMPLLQSASLPADDVLQIGNERTVGSSITISDAVTLTLEKNSTVLLYKNTISLSGSGKVVDMGAGFGVFSYGATQFHDHSTKIKAYVDNGDGTHSATVDCSTCKILYHVPMGTAGEMSAPHNYGSDGKCTLCGVSAVAKVSDPTGESYYTDMAAAVRDWAENSLVSGEKTLTLLQSGAWENPYSSLSLPNDSRILDLNGFKLTIGIHAVQPQGTQLIIRDSSSAGSGVLNAYFDDAAASSLTLESGQLVSSSSAAIAFDLEGSSVTVTGGGIAVSGANYSIKAPVVTVSGAVSIEGPVRYSEGTVLTFSGYTGDGVDVHFVSDYTGGTDITLPEKYGFHDSANVQLTGTIAAGTTARMKLIHEHIWGFSAEGAVITAVCSGGGACPVEGGRVTITLTAPADLTYNGSKKNCTVKQEPIQLIDPAALQIEYSAVPVAVGDYTASLSCEGVKAELAFSILGIDISGMSLPTVADQTYTGAAITPEMAVDGLTAGTDYTVTYENNVNAGTARILVTGKGNYSGTLEKTFTIKPAMIQITAALAKDTYEYTGSVIEPEITVKTNFGGTEMNLAKDMDYKLSGESKTDAGSVVTMTVEAIEGGNFVFEPVTFQYRIVQAEPACQAPGGFTATYGQSLYMLSLPTAENGSWSWRAPTSSVGAVGEQTHSAIFTPTDSVNYKSVYVDVPVKVEPAVLTVTGVNIANKPYDGSDQVAVSSLIINGRVGSDDVTIAGLSTLKATAPSANAGSYTEITLPTLTLTGADSGNYTLVQPGKVPASYTIARKVVYPVVEVAAGTYRYNGMAQTPTVTVRDGAAVIPAEEYTVSYSSNLHVGTGYATVSDKEGGNYDLTQVTGSFTIQTTTITITADNKSATTGQKAPALTYTVTGLVAGEKLSKEPTVSYVTTPNMSKAGTTLIRAGGAVAPSSDYTISYVDGTLTVIKASSSGGSYTGSYTGNVSVTVDMSDVELVSKTYDGKPISFGGKASARYYTGNFTYTWYTASGYKLSEAPTDAGDYTLRATVNRSGYTGYASKNVTIRKAALTITADDLRANVGDAAPKLSYSVKGLGSGDKLKTEPQLSYEKEPDMTKPGEVPIIVSGAEAPDTKNYEKDIRYIEGTLTIGEAEPEEEKTSEERGEPAEPAEPMRKLEVSVGSASRELEKALDSKNCAYYELALRESADGGANWAAGSQLPEGGVQVSLPLPEGSDENCSFRVVHADGEYPATLVRKEDGKWYLEFTAAELGSVAVGWTAPGKEGGFPWWLLPLLAVGGGVVGIVCNRKRRRSY